jgi:hypothetical protein
MMKMTITNFDNTAVSRLRFGALVFLLSGMSFIGCGGEGPPAPQIKKVVVTLSNGAVSTLAYSYTHNKFSSEDHTLSEILVSKANSERVEQIAFSYDYGTLNHIGYESDYVPDQWSLNTKTLDGTYRNEKLTDMSTGLDSLFSGMFGGTRNYDLTIGYNSEGFIKDVSTTTTKSDKELYRTTRQFTYTSDSLFESIREENGDDSETTEFEYTTEGLISAIEESSESETERHTYSYNDDGQLKRYSGALDCDYTYNNDGLVKEIDCGSTTYTITYYRGESVSGMIPRLSFGIEHGEYFSLDGKPLTPRDFAEPYTFFSDYPRYFHLRN